LPLDSVERGADQAGQQGLRGRVRRTAARSQTSPSV